MRVGNWAGSVWEKMIKYKVLLYPKSVKTFGRFFYLMNDQWYLEETRF